MKLNLKSLPSKRMDPVLVLSILALVVAALLTILLIIGRTRSAEGDVNTASSGQSTAYTGKANAVQAADTGEEGWPRKINSGDTTILFYHPEIEQWQGDQIQAYSAVSVETSGSERPAYGQ